MQPPPAGGCRMMLFNWSLKHWAITRPTMITNSWSLGLVQAFLPSYFLIDWLNWRPKFIKTVGM